MIDRLHQWDQDLTLWINTHQPVGAIDSVMVFFSKIPVWIPLYLLVYLYIFYDNGVLTGLEKRKNFTNVWASLIYLVFGAGLTILLCDQTANLFKDGFERLRPCHDGYMVSNGLRILENKGGFYGFFSGHSANAFGWATVTSLIIRRKGYTWLIYIWAALVAVSRIYVGKHFLGDILVGAAFGILIGWLAYKVSEFLIKTIGKQIIKRQKARNNG